MRRAATATSTSSPRRPASRCVDAASRSRLRACRMWRRTPQRSTWPTATSMPLPPATSALSADGMHLLGSFTPSDYNYLQANDIDLGSTAPALLPREPHSRTPLMAVQG